MLDGKKEVNLNDAKIPPFGKGGPKATSGEFLQQCLERSLTQ
jgi:hypothetical protein